MVVVPLLEKGLTAKEMALKMTDPWAPFGIPSIIKTNQGSHFTADWWNAMCANVGIRQVYSQAYHHASNGRAQWAGQQVMEMPRKVALETEESWVALLPKVVNFFHDTPSEVGFYPYQIAFGRERPLANRAFTPRECPDAQDFF